MTCCYMSVKDANIVTYHRAVLSFKTKDENVIPGQVISVDDRTSSTGSCRPSLTMSSTDRRSFFWLSTAALTMAAACAWYYITTDTTDEWPAKNSPPSPKKDVGDMNALVQERFNSCVAHMKKQLSSMPQNSQLEFYALYKQASLGDAVDFVGQPPPSYDMVASAKYRAWKSKEGVSQSRAMQEYIDKAVHFEFTRTIVDDDDDEDFDLEGEAVIEMNGMGIKPSTLAEQTNEEKAAEAEDDKAYPLHAASRDNDLECLEKLLQGDDKRDPNELDPFGQTALHLAADARHPEAIRILTQYGADVNAADHDGISVLQAAVISGDFETCRLLCELGANPDQADGDGDTPRKCAKDDPVLRDLLFRASMNNLGIDDDFQEELQTIGKAASAASPMMSESSRKEDINALDDVRVELDDEDTDMF